MLCVSANYILNCSLSVPRFSAIILFIHSAINNSMAKENIIYILDSGAFLRGSQNEFADKPCVTVFGVLEEMKSLAASIEMDRFLLSGLQVLEPSAESMEEAESGQKKTQDKVSRTDISLVALALDFRKKKKGAVLVSDDYAVQNICKILNVSYMPLATEGIRKAIEWRGRCQACGFRTNEKLCPECGSKVRFGGRVIK